MSAKTTWLMVFVFGGSLLLILACTQPADGHETDIETAYCAEDPSHSQYIDTSDIALLTGVFGLSGPVELDIAPPLAPDGFIDTQDISAITGHFGTQCFGTTGTEIGGDSLTASVWQCQFKTAGFALGPAGGGTYVGDWGGQSRCLNDGGSFTSFCRFQFEYRDGAGAWHTIAVSQDVTMAGTYCIAQGFSVVLPHYTVLRGSLWHWIDAPPPIDWAHPPMFHAELATFCITVCP